MSERARQLFDAIGAQLVLAELGGEPPRVGEYAIEAILGAGGFGLICRATQLALHRRVALKLYPLGGDEDSGVREALREARSLARLEHPGIVGVYAAGEGELIAGVRLACAFVELQYVEGQTLRAWLGEGSRSADEVIRVLLEAGRALAHAHDAGVVHRDFKPENLMIDRMGRARVIDFGLALATEQVDAALADWSSQGDALGTRATATGLVRGTPGYMAPEASQGLPRAASDQFAFAVVVREALTGKHPFHPGVGRAAPIEGPERFARIKPEIDRAMAPSPEDRFASMAALCDAIAEALGQPSATPNPRRARRKLAGLALLGLASAGTVTAYALDLDLLRFGDAPITTTPTREPEPASEPEPTPIAEHECAALEAWAGAWQVGGVVAWTEYAYQLDWWLTYELELAIGDECRVDVHARRYRPRAEGEPRGEAVVAEAGATAIFDAGEAGESPGWRLPLTLLFVGDTATYANEERYELALRLDRVDGRERLSGGFRRIDGEGNWIRTGALLGDREQTPTRTEVLAARLDCPARCRIACAGVDSERACVERGCADDRSGDPCGPPSLDFTLPLRVRVASKDAARGDDLLEQSLAQGSRTKMLTLCSANAQAIVGRWSVEWIDHEARTGSLALELAAEGCRLSGRAEADGESTELSGEVTVAGTWLLRPSTPIAALPQPLVLVGVGPDAPAFGGDLQDPARRLRAHRRP
ncbi:serine/threonine-protein kinase [Nannocystaceae bacterium ST9]